MDYCGTCSVLKNQKSSFECAMFLLEWTRILRRSAVTLANPSFLPSPDPRIECIQAQRKGIQWLPGQSQESSRQRTEFGPLPRRSLIRRFQPFRVRSDCVEVGKNLERNRCVDVNVIKTQKHKSVRHVMKTVL